jgi:hypothetical protein
MRSILLICAIWLMILAVGCKRSGQHSANNSAGSPQVSNGLGDARAQLEKGKELYRNDQDAEAVLAFMEAVRLDPNRPKPNTRRPSRLIRNILKETPTTQKRITPSGRPTRILASTATPSASIARPRS